MKNKAGVFLWSLLVIGLLFHAWMGFGGRSETTAMRNAREQFEREQEAEIEDRIQQAYDMGFHDGLYAASAEARTMPESEETPRPLQPPQSPAPLESPSPTQRSTPRPSFTPVPTLSPTPASRASTPKPATDTRTYVLNTNTYKFHKPTCSSVDQMKESNKEYYEGTREEVIDMGYTPCGRCHP